MLDRIFVYGVLLREAHEAAVLLDHRLTFDGFATVEECDGERVLGGIIDTERLDRYDAIEGVNPDDPGSTRGFYRREWIELADGTFAWVYKMNRLDRFPEPPSRYMLQAMSEQYERLGHDPSSLGDPRLALGGGSALREAQTEAYERSR
jgi:gamma-glutamylcyclotransferase (GGCT)/AIG2-like uncharacterized protein YtfP